MANYSLVVDSTFQPFSYSELLAPVMHQQQVHDKLVEEYDKLSTQADVLEAMGKNDRDKDTYSKYKSYSDKLRAEADALYAHGITSESRRRLSDLRRMYNTDIVPIQHAWTKREKEAEMQIQAAIKNPALRFTRDASKTPIKDYIDNPASTFGVINLDAIKSDMKTAAENLSKQIRGGYNKDIDTYTYNHISQFGLDPNLISDWIAHPDKSPALTRMMNQVLSKHGVTAEMLKSNPDLYSESLGAAQLGAWNAVGEDKEHILENYGNRLTAKTTAEAAKNGSDDEDLYPYIVGEQDMPLIMGNTDDRKKTEEYATKLGFSKGGGNGKRAVRVSIGNGKTTSSIGSKGISADMLKSNNPREQYKKETATVKDAVLFDGGRMLSRDDFMKQGKNASEKYSLGVWYDNNVTPALQHFGYSIGDTPTSIEFGRAYRDRYESGAAAAVRGIDITQSSPGNWSKMAASNAYPIKGFDRKKGAQMSDSAIKLNDILIKADKGDATISKTVYTNYNNKPAFLFEVTEGSDTKIYAVPLDRGRKDINEGIYYIEKAKEAEEIAKKYEGTAEGKKFMRKRDDFLLAGFGLINNSLITYGSQTAKTYDQRTATQIEK